MPTSSSLATVINYASIISLTEKMKNYVFIFLIHFQYHECVFADAQNDTCGFRCPEGYCIPKDLVCDGTAHCLDESDENDCNICGHKCPEGYCLPSKLKCDGTPQCSDGSDEWQCNTTKVNQKIIKNNNSKPISTTAPFLMVKNDGKSSCS